MNDDTHERRRNDHDQETGNGGASLAALSSLPYMQISLVGLFVLALFYTLYIASEFLIPVIAAIILNLVLAPIQRLLRSFHIPSPLSAAIIVVTLVAALLGCFYSISGPVVKWMDRMPEIAAEIDEKISAIREPIEEVRRASDKVEEMTKVEGVDETEEVVVRQPGMLQTLFGSLGNFTVQFSFCIILLFFLLAVGDLFRRNLIRITPHLKDKLRAERIVNEVEHEVSIYLLTITLINIGLGTVLGICFYLLDLPNAFLWGLAAALLNFIPYLGGLVGVAGIAIVSLLTYESLLASLIPPLVYLGVNTFEGQIITPSILSYRMTLNPVLVFLTVMFWAWFWGVPGALMGVPLLVIFKILCDYTEPLRPIGELLEGNSRKPMPLPADPLDHRT